MARPRKHNPPLPDHQRVAEYRQRMRQQGYRNVSFLVSPEEYDLIESARAELSLTSKELLMYYLTGQYLQIGKGYSCLDSDLIEPELNLSDPNDRQTYLKLACQRGELFHFPRQKEYVIASVSLQKKLFPSWFPFEVQLLKSFETYRDALIYFVAKKSTLAKTRQWILLRRDSTQDFVWESETEYYTNRLLLNDIYPQLDVFYSAADPIQYQVEWLRILAEYED